MPAGHYDRTRIPRRGRPGFLRGILGDLDREWMNKSLCSRMPLSEVDEIFFPIGGRSHDAKRDYQQRVSRAKAICGRCPVRDDCEQYRARIQDENGVWGGRDEQDRDLRHPTPHGPYTGAPPSPRHCPGSGAAPLLRRGDRGKCPGCNRFHSVRRDGFIFNHLRSNFVPK